MSRRVASLILLAIAFVGFSPDHVSAQGITAWGRSGYANIDSLTTTKQISAGLYHTAELLPDGLVACHGIDHYRQCRTPQNASASVQITCGAYHTLALQENGDLIAWGPVGLEHPADLNEDGMVNGADLGILLGAWST